MVVDRDQVYREYGRMFHPENLHRLTAEDFKGFLLYDNNRHWWGITRQQTQQTRDMGALRRALSVLLDKSRRIDSRLDWYFMGEYEPKPVPGLGQAVITPIMHVVYPDRYGVRQTRSQRVQPPGWGSSQNSDMEPSMGSDTCSSISGSVKLPAKWESTCGRWTHSGGSSRRNVGGHEILPGGGRVTARWWPSELPSGARWLCPC